MALTPTPVPTPDKKRDGMIVIGVVLGVVIALWFAANLTLGLVLGFLSGAIAEVGFLLLVGFGLRRVRWRSPIPWFVAGLAPIGLAIAAYRAWPALAVGVAIGGVAFGHYLFFREYLVTRAHLRVIRTLIERLDTNVAIDDLLAAIATWRDDKVYRAAEILLDRGRAADGERIVAAAPLGSRAPAILNRADYLVTMRLALDDVDGARAVVEELAESGAQHHYLASTMLGMLRARVATVAGDAHAGLVLVGPLGADPDLPVTLRLHLDLAHADAAAATGDRELARRLLEAAARVDAAAVASLAKSNRPSAAIAIALEIPPQPFR